MFQTPSKVRELNDTLVSLCNVSYKIVIEIIVQKIREMVDNIINPW